MTKKQNTAKDEPSLMMDIGSIKSLYDEDKSVDEVKFVLLKSIQADIKALEEELESWIIEYFTENSELILEFRGIMKKHLGKYLDEEKKDGA